jgi:hypothetical protein
MDVFYDRLATEQQRIIGIIKQTIVIIPSTEEEQNNYDQPQSCVRCKETFSNEKLKVRHYNHRTGKFVDALCSSCNPQVKYRAMIPVVFNNSKNYDARHVFRSFTKRIAVKYDKRNVSLSRTL